MTRRNAFLLPLLGYSAAAQSSTQTPENPESLIWSLDKIQWQREEFGGAKYAVIDGDREKPGSPFSYAFWIPPRVWVPAHTHTQQAQVSVLKGTLLLGFGKKMDKKKTVKIPTGQFFIVRGGVPHFEGCDEETLIIGSALGGWQTRMLD
jgi:hypothetical protein